MRSTLIDVIDDNFTYKLLYRLILFFFNFIFFQFLLLRRILTFHKLIKAINDHLEEEGGGESIL
jgi:hypothetical protein